MWEAAISADTDMPVWDPRIWCEVAALEAMALPIKTQGANIRIRYSMRRGYALEIRLHDEEV
jgi:hypothetical protein